MAAQRIARCRRCSAGFKCRRSTPEPCSALSTGTARSQGHDYRREPCPEPLKNESRQRASIQPGFRVIRFGQVLQRAPRWRGRRSGKSGCRRAMRPITASRVTSGSADCSQPTPQATFFRCMMGWAEFGGITCGACWLAELPSSTSETNVERPEKPVAFTLLLVVRSHGFPSPNQSRSLV